MTGERVFGLTTRGLETVSAGEMKVLPGVTVTEVAYRRVNATCDSSLDSLLGLRTVDDIFLDITTWTNIKHTRDMLKRFVELSQSLDLENAREICASLRPIYLPPVFSVTANFVGQRNYNVDEIKRSVAAGIEATHDWRYSEDEGVSDLNLRVFIEHTTAYIGLRLGRDSLQKRPYKQEHLPGSLKPPVAAAMAILAGVESGNRVLDPFCGTGTILIEAARLDARVYGGDSSTISLEKARTNLNAAGIISPIQRWDARALPFANHSADCVISNLPWGRQVQVDAALETLYHDAFAEMRRILVPGGRAALLTTTPQLLTAAAIQQTKQIEISLFGQNPLIVLFEDLR
jgi:23S rRNA G2445 N2-methylase RlmL